MNQFLTKLPLSSQAHITFYMFRAEGMLHRMRFLSMRGPANGWPILLGISFPKSGTHLLSQILLGFSKIGPFTPHIPLSFGAVEARFDKKQRVSTNSDKNQKLQAMFRYFDMLRPLDITKAHLPAWPEVTDRVSSPPFLTYFIFRDLRDVVVSFVFYVTEMEPGHRLHQYFSENLKTFDERLMCSIQGFKSTKGGFSNVEKRFRQYSSWLDCPEVLSIRFEDLVNNRQTTLGSIADHFTRKVDTIPVTRDEIIDSLESSINPSKSPTFRSGKTGEWRKYFTDEHKNAFKEVAGDLLIRLGYEKDNDW